MKNIVRKYEEKGISMVLGGTLKAPLDIENHM